MINSQILFNCPGSAGSFSEVLSGKIFGMETTGKDHLKDYASRKKWARRKQRDGWDLCWN